MSNRVLHLHIDRVVVDGLPASAQRQFVRAFRSRLIEMAESGIADGYAQSTRRRIATVNAGELRVGATAEHAAAQVASSIHKSIAGGGEARGHV